MGDPLGFKIASEKFKICPWWILICISRNPAFFRRVTQKPAQEEKRPAVRCFFFFLLKDYQHHFICFPITELNENLPQLLTFDGTFAEALWLVN